MKAKTIYLEEEVIEKIMKDSLTNNFSKRIQDLVEKGMLYEAKGEKTGVREAILSLIKAYNCKTNTPIPI